jgi:signal transduction histidine kinase
MREVSDQHSFLLATLPPSRGQIRLALGIVVVLLLAFGLMLPFTNVQLPRVDAFIPAFATAILISDLITAALLFAQFFVVRRLAPLVLAGGYLFTALIVIPYALTFPGLFAHGGLMGAGLQSTVWLYIFWHTGFPLAILVYVLFKDADGRRSASQRWPVAAIGWSIAILVAIVCGLSWVATAGNDLLPRIILDGVQMDPGRRLLFGGLMAALSAAALTLLWVRRRTVLDLWLVVVCCAWLLELMISAVFINARFSLGWYSGRLYALLASIFILLVLLSETTTLYAHLARSVAKQRRDREARQIAMDAMAASIAHEVNQPLGAIAANTEAALIYLAKTPPDNDQVRAAIEAIASDSARGAEVIAGLRTMFKKDVHGRVWFSVNDLVRDALASLDIDLRTQRVSVSTELREEVPRLFADRGQLQQVFLNLIMNAIDSMRSVTDRTRRLRLTSDIVQGSSEILITIEDSGVGIDGKEKDRIFEPFFTTKSTGTGIGLTICRSIIDSHGGSLRASPNNPYGTIFHLVLPMTAE